MKFNRYHVTDGCTKVRCDYSLDNRTDERKCVTIWAKDYNSGLGRLFPGSYENNSDGMTDYFERGRVVLFEDHPLYAVARPRVEEHLAKETARRNARLEKLGYPVR